MSNVATLRQKRNLTQRQLADLVEVTESTIRNWERNRNAIKWFERIAKLCKALDCTPEDLINYVEAENSCEGVQD